MKNLLFVFMASLLLLGCGGGSDKKTSPPASNPPPASTSSAPASSSKSSSSTTSSATSSAVTTTSSAQASSIPFAFNSNSFTSGDKIPIKYSCFGGETSPELHWDITSDAIKSFVLIMEDYDAIALIGRPYVHWNVYNIPADTRQFTEGATLHAMPLGSIEGVTDDGPRKYMGPCPPEGTGTHHYFFALYALNKTDVSVNTNLPQMRSDFETQHADAIIQKAEISGSYFYK